MKGAPEVVVRTESFMCIKLCLEHPHSPTVRGGVVQPLDHRPVQPGNGVIDAGFVRVGQFLNLKLIVHKGVGHHAIHQQHERGRGAVDQRAHASHHHHQSFLPCGKAELDRGQWCERKSRITSIWTAESYRDTYQLKESNGRSFLFCFVAAIPSDTERI